VWNVVTVKAGISAITDSTLVTSRGTIHNTEAVYTRISTTTHTTLVIQLGRISDAITPASSTTYIVRIDDVATERHVITSDTSILTITHIASIQFSQTIWHSIAVYTLICATADIALIIFLEAR